MWNQVEEALNHSMNSVITGAANLLPRLVALLVAFLVSALFAWLATVLVRRFLRGIDLDGTMARWGLFTPAEVSPLGSPTVLISRLVAWSVVFVGLLIGVAAFDATLTSRLMVNISTYLPNVAVAVILFTIGATAARFLARTVLIGAVNMNVQYARLLSIGVKWLVLVLVSAMALNHLGIGGRIVDEAFTILFGGIVLALALAFGLGAKDAISRSLEGQAGHPPSETNDSTFQHY